MKKDQFKVLIKALYGNNQLFIPQGQTIDEWIDNVYAINTDQEKQLCYCPDRAVKHFIKNLCDECKRNIV